MLKNIISITIIITLEGTEKIKTKKKEMTTKQSEQLRERFQVKWLLFSLNEQYITRIWLGIAKSCHLSFKKL